MYKLVATDMDETFLDHDHQIPEANIRAMQRMKELGVLFVPSSGRWYSSIMDNFAHLDPALLEGSYVISYNGGFINRYGENEPILSTIIDRDIIETLYAHAREHRVPLHVYTPSGKIYMQFLDDDERAYMVGVEGAIELADDVDVLDEAAPEDFVKILFKGDGLEAAKALGERARPLLDAERVAITYSSNRYVEFVPVGIDKGTGLVHLAELLGVDVADTIAVGDSANDLGMLRAAGLGVGVGNVTDDARGACDLVLETTADEGAFPELVRRVLEPEHRA